MRVHISVCSLLVCSTLGLLAGADPVRTKGAEGIDENAIQDNDNVIENPQALETMRLKKEYSVFKTGLMMLNDHGEPVELTLDDDAETTMNDLTLSDDLNGRVHFRLYTRKNPYNFQELRINDMKSLEASNFNADMPTHFVTHGWINSGASPACTLIRDAFLKNGDYNVIIVDWSKITMRPYSWAVARVLMVGKYVAKMIDFLESHARLNTEKTTLAGHSLGAHVMGLGGYYAKGTVNHVVGLDPALPLFVFAGIGSRISNADANHVQIIHTNAGLLGYFSEIGHSDFYPNGGTRQLGCLLDLGGACSHARSYEFYAESINTKKGFIGRTCKTFISYVLGICKNSNEAVMGGSIIDFTKSGKYFLSTTSASPYAKGG